MKVVCLPSANTEFDQLFCVWDSRLRCLFHRRFAFTLSDVEDLTQETWMKIWDMWPQNSCPSSQFNVGGYILRVARNLAVDRIRRNNCYHRILCQPDYRAHTVPVKPFVTECTAEKKYLFREVIGEPISSQQEQILSFLIKGYTSCEIGKELGLTAMAVRKSISRLRCIAKSNRAKRGENPSSSLTSTRRSKTRR